MARATDFLQVSVLLTNFLKNSVPKSLQDCIYQELYHIYNYRIKKKVALRYRHTTTEILSFLKIIGSPRSSSPSSHLSHNSLTKLNLTYDYLYNNMFILNLDYHDSTSPKTSYKSSIIKDYLILRYISIIIKTSIFSPPYPHTHEWSKYH